MVQKHTAFINYYSIFHVVWSMVHLWFVGIDRIPERSRTTSESLPLLSNHSPVFAEMFSRTKSPLDKCLRPKLCAILSEMVPFPEPGGPIITARNNLDIFSLNRPVCNRNESSVITKTTQSTHSFIYSLRCNANSEITDLQCRMRGGDM